MNKVLIIGKKSFIGTNLKKYLKKKIKVKILSFEEALKKKNNFFSSFSHIINTSIHKKYIHERYNSNYDLDKKFIDKFQNYKFTYVFLNTRKIYRLKQNISENSKLNPKKNYEKNKLRTENYLKNKLKKKLLSLRISNIIGKRIFKNSTRNNHKLFFDNFLNLKKTKNNQIIVVNDDFKDFLSINQFSKIILLLIKKKVIGIFNVSLSKKVFVSEIVRWLDINTFKKVRFKQVQQDSFTLLNKKLVNKIEYKPTKKQLELFCRNIFN